MTTSAQDGQQSPSTPMGTAASQAAPQSQPAPNPALVDPAEFIAQFDDPRLRAPIMKRNEAQPETRER
jgi:hypothetical protein